MLTAEALLAGPRGRRLCWELVWCGMAGATLTDSWNLVWTAVHSGDLTSRLGEFWSLRHAG